MTYTFKLARRLAVLRTLSLARTPTATRNFGMLAALLLMAACSGEDATSPQSSADPTSAVAVRITPRRVILATDQPIRFLARGLNTAGDSVGTTVAWRTTGGSILPDGRFSAGTIGTFMVIGSNRNSGDLHVDTAVVVVVRRQPQLVSIDVRPGSISLTPGDSVDFTVIGRTIRDRVVPIGVKWTATGGTIDPAGTYVAGDSIGTFRVVAVNMGGTVTDTAAVVITPTPASSVPPDSVPVPPVPPAPEPPKPVLGGITLVPSVVTLAPSTTRQFSAYGRTTDGDSVAADVVFVATGGTVTQGGLFTAGSSAGNFRIIASDGVVADTSLITVSSPLGSGPATGIPFGPFDLFKTFTGPAVQGFDGSISYVTPAGILTLINSMRANGVRSFLKLTGETHSDPDGTDTYRTNFKFDLAKWKSELGRYNTPAIKTAIAQAVADGTLIGYSMIDEPNHTTWGGVVTKATLDEMATYSKSLFPTLPTAAVVPYYWRATERYKVLDAIIAQTWKPTQTPVAFRDEALAAAKLNGVAIALSVNIMAGPQVAGCEPRPNGTTCLMSPSEIKAWTTTFASQPPTCAVFMWRYDPTLWQRSAYVQVFKEISTALKAKSARSCQRP